MEKQERYAERFDEEEVVQIGRGMVTVMIRVVKRTGDFETLSVQYGATVPLEFNEGEVKGALERARDLVVEQMISDMDEIKKVVV